MRASQGRPTLVDNSIRHPQDTSNTSTQNPCPLGDVSGGFTYIDKDLGRALSTLVTNAVSSKLLFMKNVLLFKEIN